MVVADADEIPEKFDLRNEIAIQVENRGNYDLCWDFVAMKSLETNLALRNQNFDFSELHLDYIESAEFGKLRELHDGGNFVDFEDYVADGYGPVYKKDVPYDAYYEMDSYEELLNIEAKAYVNKTINFPTISKPFQTYTDEELTLFRSKVKKHIMENGSIYAVVIAPDYGAAYFNEATNAE